MLSIALKNVCSGMLTKVAIVLHDDANPHVACTAEDCRPCVQHPQESNKGPQILVRQRSQGHTGTVVPSAAQGVLCGEVSSAGASMGCLPKRQ